MSFLYPRTVTITRPGILPVAGDGGYAGLEKTNETTIATGVPASIQDKSSGGSPQAKVPSDAQSRDTPWLIFIPAVALAKGAVEFRDIVTDDLGQRYQVVAPYWDSLGYALRATPLVS